MLRVRDLKRYPAAADEQLHPVEDEICDMMSEAKSVFKQKSGPWRGRPIVKEE